MPLAKFPSLLWMWLGTQLNLLLPTCPVCGAIALEIIGLFIYLTTPPRESRCFTLGCAVTFIGTFPGSDPNNSLGDLLSTPDA